MTSEYLLWCPIKL